MQGAPAVVAGRTEAAPAALETAPPASARCAYEAPDREQRNCGSLDTLAPNAKRDTDSRCFSILPPSILKWSVPTEGFPPRQRLGILDARLALSRWARSQSSCRWMTTMTRESGNPPPESDDRCCLSVFRRPNPGEKNE